MKWCDHNQRFDDLENRVKHNEDQLAEIIEGKNALLKRLNGLILALVPVVAGFLLSQININIQPSSPTTKKNTASLAASLRYNVPYSIHFSRRRNSTN